MIEVDNEVGTSLGGERRVDDLLSFGFAAGLVGTATVAALELAGRQELHPIGNVGRQGDRVDGARSRAAARMDGDQFRYMVPLPQLLFLDIESPENGAH